MRTFLLSILLAFGVGAAPVITSLSTSTGFRYGQTKVIITGTGFSDSTMVCVDIAGCPVKVFAGNVPAYVREVSPTSLLVYVDPRVDGKPVPSGTTVPIRVVVPGKGEATRPGFTFYDSADSFDNYTQYLVPITGEVISGANGSQWTGEFTLFNASPNTAVVLGPFNPPGHLSPVISMYTDLGPRRTEESTLFGSGGGAGAFIHVPNPLAHAVKKSLRVRDLSKNASSWGTEVPVVSVQETSHFVTLIDIPTDPKYRATLRVYHWAGGNQASGVSIYAPNREEPIARYELEARSLGAGFEGEPPLYPAYAQVDLLTPAIRAAGPTIRVEIDNFSWRFSPPPPQIWAFVSVTNNETQQVTVITPEQ
ncbi:MAG TPA: IPT/TIG domain-containing protein [Thermoanaerobaculia bacterium]|jgi:hypothetical protein